MSKINYTRQSNEGKSEGVSTDEGKSVYVLN
jgi:hypothetical protein